jgi:hypothetical protein
MFNVAAAPIRWTGSGFEWWCIDGGGGFQLESDFSLLAGLKVMHSSIRLDDPRDGRGYPLNWSQTIVPFHFQFRAGGDIQARVWVPYIGLRVKGPNYRCTFQWSPCAWARIRVSDQGSYLQEVDPPAPAGSVDTGISWRYSKFSPGAYLEGLFEYDFQVVSDSLVRLWCQGQWLSVKGGGNVDVSYAIATNGLYVGGPGAIPTVSSALSASYNQYSISGGLSASLTF